ncbi:MAG TPA: hypothetical protein VF177_19910 [Anaerolineae bacterium]
MGFIRVGVVVGLALVAGFVGLAMLFGDLGPEETLASRAAMVAGLHLVVGVVVGLVEPVHWKLAGLAAWGAVVMALGVLLGNLGRGIEEVLPGLVLFVPLALALVGGYAGRWLRRRMTAN